MQVSVRAFCSADKDGCGMGVHTEWEITQAEYISLGLSSGPYA